MILPISLGVLWYFSKSDEHDERILLAHDSIDYQSRTPTDPVDRQPNRPSVEITNDGTTPVWIESVRSSCGCASAWVEPKIIPPNGGRGRLIVDADLLEVGVRSAIIDIETNFNMTKHVNVRLFIKGYAKPPYFLQTALSEI